MKNISLAVNAVLILAVGFLYYKDFSAKKTNTESAETASSDSAQKTILSVQPIANITSLPKGIPVVFLNSDSIFANYEFAKKAKSAGEGKISSLQKNYQDKAASLQKDYNDYMDKAGKGGYTKEEALSIEGALMKRRDELVAMEQSQDKVLNSMDDSNLDVLKKIYNYMSRFNKEHGYYCALAYTRTGGVVIGINDSLDVTKIVIDGLNAEYKAGKGK